MHTSQRIRSYGQALLAAFAAALTTAAVGWFVISPLLRQISPLPIAVAYVAMYLALSCFVLVWMWLYGRLRRRPGRADPGPSSHYLFARYESYVMGFFLAVAGCIVAMLTALIVSPPPDVHTIGIMFALLIGSSVIRGALRRPPRGTRWRSAS